MKIEYSKEDDALYITLKEADVADTDELTEDIIIDYDNGGNIVGIEVLDAAQHVDMESISISTKLESQEEAAEEPKDESDLSRLAAG